MTSESDLEALLAKWDSTERPEGWNNGDEHHLAASLIGALRRHSREMEARISHSEGLRAQALIDRDAARDALTLRERIEEARTAWWSATENGDTGLIYTERIEGAMDDIWSAIGHADWTPDSPTESTDSATS